MVVGEVIGHGTDGFIAGDDATRDACELAAGIGATAIFITGHGTTLVHGDLFQRRVSGVRAQAIRLDAQPCRRHRP